MEEEIKWQFAPEFYKYIVSLLEKASNYKQLENYDNAFNCYVDIYSSLLPIIETKDLNVAEELKKQKMICESAQDEIYLELMKNDINKDFYIAKNYRLFKKNMEKFFEILMRGALIAGILLPIEKSIEKGKEALQVRY